MIYASNKKVIRRQQCAGHIDSPNDIDPRAKAFGPISLWVSWYDLPAHRRHDILYEHGIYGIIGFFQ